MLAHWATTRAWMLLGAATHCIALLGVVATLGCSAYAGVTLEERRLPMKFSWVACQPNCRGWISAWRARPRVAGRLLRIHVRFSAPVGQVALRA
jgi:hypothetical protein